MGVTLKELREQVQADKRLAIEVIQKADHAVDHFDHAVMLPDITGQPGAVARFNQFKRDQLRGLQAVGRSPFFARIDTGRTDGSGTERVKLLVSKARDTGGDVYGSDWEVVSWTSPITAFVLDRPVGDRVEFVRRSKVVYVVGASAKYEEVVPRVRNADLVFASGKASVVDEDQLLEKVDAIVAAPPAEPEPAQYEAKPTFGLSDIIVLADQPQRAAMMLPFEQTVIIEGQDLSPCHIVTLASQLAPRGTMSLVGDLHQNLNPLAGLRRWEDARVRDVAKSVFGINYRQTRELGEFLKDLHRGLFGEVPGWAASDKTTGALPRVGTIRSLKDLSRAVAAEARRWRDEIPNATVAVLYDGKMEPKRRQWLRRQLEEALSDQLTTVDAVSPASGGSPLRRTDRVVIASVKQTKGLEFDAVVFIETKPRWSRPAIEVELRARNGLYVAASRARAGLSLCMVNLPSCVEEVMENGRCERAEWPEDL